MRSSESHTLGVVAGRAGYDATGFLLFGQLRYFVIRATELERARVLEVFGLQKYLSLGIEVGYADDAWMTRHFTQHLCCMVDFAYA